MTPNALQKRFHTDFLKQTNTASAHFQGEQTHLWMEVQEMGGLVSGGAVKATCVKDTQTGTLWS